MNDFILSLACFLATLALYFANKNSIAAAARYC